MPHPHRHDPDEEERRLARAEDERDEAGHHRERLDRAAERASLAFWHSSLARLERGDPDPGSPAGREAA